MAADLFAAKPPPAKAPPAPAAPEAKAPSLVLPEEVLHGMAEAHHLQFDSQIPYHRLSHWFCDRAVKRMNAAVERLQRAGYTITKA